MTEIHNQIQTELDKSGITPLLGDLIPETVTAALLGYSKNHFSSLARSGQNPLPFVKRGNRRFYSISEITRLVMKAQDK